jgi:hypothetical protein
MVVLRQEMKKINKRDQLAIVLRHQAFQADGENIELYTAQRFCRIMVEGDPDFFLLVRSLRKVFRQRVLSYFPKRSETFWPMTSSRATTSK